MLLVLDDSFALATEALPGGRAPRYTLHVSLAKTTHGVYNPTGRGYVMRKIQRVETAQRVQQDISEWLENPSSEKTIPLSDSPLLWCGGGVLPIVKYGDEYWCMTYLRERTPVAQSPLVGGAEDENERVELEQLVVREFCEEAVIVTRPPDRGRTIDQRKFEIPWADSTKGRALEEQMLGLKFTQDYRKFRKEKEGIVIERSDALDRLKVRDDLRTPFRIHVKD